MNNPEEKYIKYLITNLEKEYKNNPSGNTNKIAVNLLNRLKNSNNLLRDIYIVSKIKNLEILSAYLLFILKKTSEKQITFDNLLENIEEDRKFLRRELMNRFGDTSYEETDEAEEEIITKRPEKIEESWQAPESEDETLGSEFLGREKVQDETETIANITEIETGAVEEVYTPEEDESMELIERNQPSEETEIYETPDKIKVKEDEKAEPEEIKEEQTEEVYSMPEEKIEEEPIMNETPDITPENFKSGKKKSAASKLKELFHFKKHKKDEHVPEEPEEEQEKIVVKPAETKHTYEDENQVKKILIEHEAEDYTDYNKSLIGEKEIPAEETVTEEEYKENALFNEYEKILRERNLIIAEGLNRIKEIEEAERTEESEEEEKTLINGITENCEYMEDYSREMTFEVITNIYSTINLSLNNVKETGFRLDNELTELFIDAIILIQKLVSGDDYTGYENTVARIESKLKILKEEKETKEREEKIKKEKEEVEKQLEEKYSDTKDRRKLLVLKNKILNLETIFKSLESIKGDFQTYEAHRTLSKTFPDFKEIVKYSVELEIENMAQLSEAAYIFIKYVQNYRIDPFGKDVKEILNYIIVNFKLLYLGKTSKDIEIFISYLNNPDKIFTEKNN